MPRRALASGFLGLLAAGVVWALPSYGFAERATEVRLPPPAVAGSEFRYLPDGAWLPFDRPLILTAAAGEERSYSIEFRDASGSRRRDFLIDRLPPPPPKPNFPSGDYRGPLAVGFEAEAGSTVWYALSDPEKGFGAFSAWDPSTPIAIPITPGRASTWVLVARAVDSSGNRSQDLRFAYRMLTPELAAESPSQAAVPPKPAADPAFDPGPVQAQVGDSRSSLSFALPRTGRLVAAVNAGGNPDRPERWFPLAVSGAEAGLVLECPYGWSGSLDVLVGIERDGVVVYRPAAYSVRLSSVVAAVSPAPLPPPPEFIDGGPGKAGLLVFPPAGADIEVSVDGGAWAPYAEPIAVEPGLGNLRIAWRGSIDGRGKSETREAEFQRPRLFPKQVLLGLEGPFVRNTPVRLRPAPGAVVRYTLSTDGSMPPPPDPSSRQFERELVLDAPDAGARTFILRYRPFSGPGGDAIAGDEGLVRYEIDRIPPPPPRITLEPPSYSRTPGRVELRPTEGRTIVAIDDGETTGQEFEYRGGIELAGSTEGAKVWTLRAWSVDAAGNRSAMAGPRRYVVDMSSTYVDSSAQGKGDGSPEAPFASLVEALASARVTGRDVICLRGDASVELPLAVTEGSPRITGGFGKDWWGPKPGLSRLRLGPGAGGLPGILVRGAELGLSGLRIVPGEGAAVLLEVVDGGLSLDGSAIDAATDTGLTLIHARKARLAVSGTTMSLAGEGGGSFIVAEDSRIRISSSDLSTGSGLGFLTALALTGGSLEMRGSRLSVAAGISLVAISGEGTAIDLDRSAISLRGSSGFRRATRLSGSEARIDNSRIESEGEGLLVLFDSRDSRLALTHDTVLVAEGAVKPLFFDVVGETPRLVNDVFLAEGSAQFLRSDRRPESGAVQYCAFAGFASYVTGGWEAAGMRAFSEGAGGAGLIELPDAAVAAAAPKGGYAIRPGSPIVDTGLRLDDPRYALDFSGAPRPSQAGNGMPDMGADELQ